MSPNAPQRDKAITTGSNHRLTPGAAARLTSYLVAHGQYTNQLSRSTLDSHLVAARADTTVRFEPEEFVNEYRGELKAMLEAKLAGEEIVAPEQPKPAQVVDLMEALKESVAQAQKQKAPAKKPAARKKRAASGSR